MASVPAPSRPKRILVTGAGTRVGAAIARRFAGPDVSIAIHYNRSRSGADAVIGEVRALGASAFGIQADLSNLRAVESLASEAINQLNGLDLLVASAANFEPVSFGELSEEAWNSALDLNLRAPVFLAHGCIPALKESSGSIVFVTGIGTNRPYKGYFPYLVSKGALKQAMRTMALELAPQVRVNAVAPGTVIAPVAASESQRREMIKAIPLGREGGGEVVADAVMELATNSFITGTEVVVDGGSSLNSGRE